MRWTAMTAVAAAMLLAPLGAAGPARADDAPTRTVRLLGTTTGGDGPRTYVLDLRIKPSDSAFQSDVSGWAASLDEGGGSSEVEGHCVENHCAIVFRLSEGAMEIAADLGGPGDGRFVFTKEDGSAPARGVTHLALATGALPGVGALAAPDAISAMDLYDLLLWNGVTPSFAPSDPKEMPDSGLHSSFADWQMGKGLPGTGLITDKDLADLRAGAAENRKTLGWAPLGDKARTWRSGYPQALLPNASTVGREQRYASADGKAVLIIALEPPPSEDAFDALVEKETADSDTREHVNYARSNGDFELRYVEKGVQTVAIWHLREGGMARLLLRYPEDQEDKYALAAGILAASFQVEDDFKAP